MLLQCLVAIFLILLIVDRWKSKKFTKIHQHIGNDWTYLPLIGNAMNFIGSNKDIMTSIMQMASQAYKRRHKAISGWIGNKFFVVIADGNQACAVLKSALDKKYIHKIVKPLIGNGAIFAPADIWHRRRKILVPTLAPKYVGQFLTVFEEQSKVTAKLLEDRVGKGNFSCFHYVNSYTLDSVCETLFGVTVDSQRNPDNTFVNAFYECFKCITARLFQPWLHIDVIYKLLPMYARQTRMLKIMQEFVDDVVCSKRALDNENNVSNKFKPNFKTFLELMIDNSKESGKTYTNEELREEMIVLAIAGTDTSAVVACFTILMLALHADIQDKVYREIQDILGDSDEPIKLKDLLKLKYLDAVIKETLRLYPPGPVITRHCTNDLELPSGLVLPQGCDVIINIWGIHRNPEHWGEDANNFNPDRFISGRILPNTFIAFSHGSRNCVGQYYAKLSIMTILATLLRQYRLIPATNFNYEKCSQLEVTFALLIKELNNFPIQIEYREKM